MKYVVYQVTCKVNGKIYVGKHQTEDLDDGYVGSGKLLRRAIKKHGLENFEKTILHVYEDEASMNAKEADLVTEEFCARDDNYNLCPGGQGGWGYVNKLEKMQSVRRNNGFNNQGSSAGGKRVQELYREEIQQRLLACNQSRFTGKKHSAETKKLLSEKAKQRPPIKGRVQSAETRKKISDALKKRHQHTRV